jgi:4-amino-4-deoxy-L-arabinose transferase-like glycosyltransferase
VTDRGGKPSAIPPSGASLPFLRAILAALSLLALLASLGPGPASWLFGGALASARAPEAATGAVRLGFAALSATLALGAGALPWILAAATGGMARLEALSGRRFVLLAVCAGASIRLATAVLGSPPATSDALWYHAAAASLAHGEGLAVDGALTAYRPPGYPWLLSLLYRLFGPHPGLAWVWGLVATILLLVSLHRIGRELYGETVARGAVLALAVYPALAFSTGQPMSDLVFTACLTALLGWALRTEALRLPASLAAGFALGLLTLIRSVGAAFFPVLLLIWFIRTRDARRLALHGLLAAAALAAPLGAWSLRNRALFGRATLATNTGLNLLIGNHPGATGGYDPALGVPAEVLQGLNEAQADGVLLDRAAGFAAAHPLQVLALWPKKLFHLFAFELSAAQEFFAGRRAAPGLKYGSYFASQAAYLVLFGLCLLRGAGLALREARPAGLQWTGFWVAGAVLFAALATFGQDRFRLPLLPWMFLEAGVAVRGLRR